jgi:hypothetical protein
MTSEVETNIVAVERINEYINVDNEVRVIETRAEVPNTLSRGHLYLFFGFSRQGFSV